MIGRRRLLLGLGLAVGAGLVRAADAAPYEATDWPALLPPGWNPQRILDGLGLEGLSDADPEAQEAMKRLRALWDAAPANPGLAARRVQIAGFMLPTSVVGREIREFLLLPHFGACIHAPAPPANQMVRVRPARPIDTAARGTSAVVVSGTLALERSESAFGVAAYAMAGDLVAPR